MGGAGSATPGSASTQDTAGAESFEKAIYPRRVVVAFLPGLLTKVYPRTREPGCRGRRKNAPASSNTNYLEDGAPVLGEE